MRLVFRSAILHTGYQLLSHAADALEKRLRPPLSPGDLLQLRLPARCQLRCAKLSCHQADQLLAFSCRMQQITLPLNRIGADQFLDNVSACSRRSQPMLLHLGQQ
ncbi:hypothetical protein D3C86_1808440 [compost metagenome]